MSQGGKLPDNQFYCDLTHDGPCPLFQEWTEGERTKVRLEAAWCWLRGHGYAVAKGFGLAVVLAVLAAWAALFAELTGAPFWFWFSSFVMFAVFAWSIYIIVYSWLTSLEKKVSTRRRVRMPDGYQCDKCGRLEFERITLSRPHAVHGLETSVCEGRGGILSHCTKCGEYAFQHKCKPVPGKVFCGNCGAGFDAGRRPPAHIPYSGNTSRVCMPGDWLKDERITPVRLTPGQYITMEGRLGKVRVSA